jgi:hypothetical protein
MAKPLPGMEIIGCAPPYYTLKSPAHFDVVIRDKHNRTLPPSRKRLLTSSMTNLHAGVDPLLALLDFISKPVPSCDLSPTLSLFSSLLLTY